MITLHAVRIFIAKNSTVAIVAAILMIGSAAVTMERSGMLPFDGQASSTYNPLPVPGAAKKKIAVKKTKSNSSRTMRAAAPDAKPAAVPTKTWTERECAGYGLPSDECKEKMRAITKGDYSCFHDEKCTDMLHFGCTLGKDCPAINIQKWAFESMFPDCLGNGDAGCIAGATLFGSASAPVAVRTCMGSALCRELLADFRRGEFTCRRNEMCLNALGALVSMPGCSSMQWCKNVAKIDELYTTNWQACPAIETPDCRSKIGVTAYASERERSIKCRHDTDCWDEARKIAEELGSGASRDSKAVVPACFLWAPCKEEFAGNKRWACETVKREPDCTRLTNIWKFLTETNKSCVTSGESKTCQDALKSFIQ